MRGSVQGAPALHWCIVGSGECLVISWPCSIPFTSLHALFEESSLDGIPRERDRFSKMVLGNLPSSGAKLEFAECRGIEWIGSEAIAAGDRLDLLKSPLGTIALCNCDSTIQRHNR